MIKNMNISEKSIDLPKNSYVAIRKNNLKTIGMSENITHTINNKSMSFKINKKYNLSNTIKKF